jgi:hypothetical protein
VRKIFGRTATAVVAITLLSAGAVAGVAQADPYAVGDIFASTGSGNVQHLNSAGVLLETLNNGSGGFTTGSAFDSAGNFYLTNFGSNTVSRFAGPGDPHTVSSFGGGYSTPESIVFAADGHVLVGNLGNGIREFDAAGNFIKTIANGRVDWFDLAADQDTILFTQEGSVVRTASRSTGLIGANFGGGGTQLFALRILPGGGILVADNGNVKRMDAAGNIIQTYDVASVNGFFALNLDPDGTTFLTGSFDNGTLYRFNIESGLQSQIINTGCGSGCLFGVSMFGEITVGNPPDLNPVPEPATLLLVGTSLAGVVGAAWRRRKAPTAG